MKINHVFSNNLKSEIFNDFINYFLEYLPDGVVLESSVKSNILNQYDVYHYHRIHLEDIDSIPPNSVATVHHCLTDTDSWLDLEKFIPRYKKLARVICLNSDQEKLLKKYNLKNTTIIPHGYNNKVLKKKELSKFNINTKIKLGVISTRYARRCKGEAYLLELMKKIDNRKFSFLFVGKYRQVDFEIAKELGFEAEFFPKIPYKIFQEIYNNIDFLLMISLFEGGPANIPEAMATATPIISSKIAMSRDLIQDKVNGLFISGNINEDLELFDDIANNKNDITNALYLQSQKGNEKLITWQEVVNRYNKLYREVTNEFN